MLRLQLFEGRFGFEESEHIIETALCSHGLQSLHITMKINWT